MQPIRHPRAAALASGALATALLGMAAAPVAARTFLNAPLSGSQVVPGPGAELEGQGAIIVDGDEVCADVFVDDAFDGFTGVALYEGAVGAAGSVVITFPAPDPIEGGSYGGCATDAAAAAAVVADPGAYFLQVATAAFPDGALRGQLETPPPPTTSVTILTLACPGGVRSIADVDETSFAPCTNVARPGDIAPPPTGYVYDPKPIAFDLHATVTDDAGTRTLAEAEPDGGGTCDTTTRVCRIARSYSWSELVSGTTTVAIANAPRGYRVGFVRVTTIEGDPVDATVSADGRTISFDSTGIDWVSIVVFDVRGGPPVR